MPLAAEPRRPRPAAAVQASQRMRIVLAAAEGATALGIPELTVAAIVARAGVSRRSYYELFANREDCLLATFEEGVRRATQAIAPACAAQSQWQAAVRSGVHALLLFLDSEPALGRFCVVDALGAGERVLARRGEVVRELTTAIDRGRTQACERPAAPPITAEALVGAVLGILHARLCDRDRSPLAALSAELTSILVRPYLGDEAAEDERRRSPPSPTRARANADRLARLRIRWTHRTIAALTAIAAAPRSSNRQVAEAVGIDDAGQISKLLSRLQRLGLIETTPPAPGAPNAWHLTAVGQEAVATLSVAARLS